MALQLDVAIFGNQPVRTLVGQVQLAESLGFAGAWIIDSQLICRELYVTMTACALGTTTIRIGAGVTVPGTRHAAVTASAMASLTELAPGRIVLGVGTGLSSVGTLGLRPARVSALDDLIATSRALLGGRSVPLETGVEGRMTWVDRPLTVPVYVGASGPRVLDLAGRVADGVLLHSGTTPEMIEGGLAAVAKGARSAGRDAASIDVAVWAPTSMGDDRASAGARHRALVPDRLIDLFALAGTPDEVAGRVKDIAAVPAVQRLVMVPQVPGEGFAGREDILRRFAETVMSRV